MAGIPVNLYTASGSLAGSTTTDEYGGYQFSSVAPGDYYAVFTKPATYSFSPLAGDNYAAASGQTATFTITTTTDQLHLDAGLVPTVYGSIGGYAWNDANDNGMWNAGESPLSGLPVSLYDPYGNAVATTTTGATGYYQFNPVAPGDYYVIFNPQPDDAPSALAYGFSPTGADSDANPSGATDLITLAPGASLTAVDGGLVHFQSAGSFLWTDANGNGLPDPGEPGVPYVTVYLYDNAGNFVAATTTDDTGHYAFNSVLPGTYYVAFTDPRGYVFTAQGAGSAADANGRTPNFTIAPGGDNLNINAGLIVTNQAPSANPDSFVAQQNQSLSTDPEQPSGSLLANDTDPDGDLLVVGAVNGSAANVGEPVTLPSGASLTVYSDGSFDYVPAAGFAGTDSFTYQASDGLADSNAVTVSIAVNAPPVVALGWDVTINEGTTFSRSGSFTDADSTSWAATVDYGDGSGQQSLSLNADHSFSLSHFYADNGAFTVTVRITDDAGGVGTATLQVTVLNVPPTAVFTASGPVVHGNPVTLSFTNTYDQSPIDTAAGFTFSYDFNNDGIFDVADSTSSSLSYVFTTAGQHRVHGRIKDKDGGFTDYWVTVMVY